MLKLLFFELLYSFFDIFVAFFEDLGIIIVAHLPRRRKSLPDFVYRKLAFLFFEKFIEYSHARGTIFVIYNIIRPACVFAFGRKAAFDAERGEMHDSRWRCCPTLSRGEAQMYVFRQYVQIVQV